MTGNLFAEIIENAAHVQEQNRIDQRERDAVEVLLFVSVKRLNDFMSARETSSKTEGNK